MRRTGTNRRSTAAVKKVDLQAIVEALDLQPEEGYESVLSAIVQRALDFAGSRSRPPS